MVQLNAHVVTLLTFLPGVRFSSLWSPIPRVSQFPPLPPVCRGAATGSAAGSVRHPNGDVMHPDGTPAPVGHDGAHVLSDGSALLSDGSLRYPDGSRLFADGSLAQPNGEVHMVDGRVLPPGTPLPRSTVPGFVTSFAHALLRLGRTTFDERLEKLD